MGLPPADKHCVACGIIFAQDNLTKSRKVPECANCSLSVMCQLTSFKSNPQSTNRRQFIFLIHVLLIKLFPTQAREALKKLFPILMLNNQIEINCFCSAAVGSRVLALKALKCK